MSVYRVYKTIEIGSTSYFDDMPDFTPNDIDLLCLFNYGDELPKTTKDGKAYVITFSVPGYLNVSSTKKVEDFKKNETLLYRQKRVIPKRDFIFFPMRSKEEILKDLKDETLLDHLRPAKFLSTEFANEIGFTIEDLRSIRPLFDKMDEKHSYLVMICDYYLENGSYTMTDEQRQAAYDIYKKYRQ